MTDGPDRDPAQPPMSPSESALAEEAERYRSLFAYSPHGVFSLDLTGRLTDANDALLGLTGYSLVELVEIDYHDIIHADDVAAGEKAFAGVIERVPQLLEARLVTASGNIREVKLTAVPVIVKDQVVGVHGITEDVTEANVMHRELRAANEAKTLFLANVSHEVRTPLTMVIGATEMLLETDLDPSQDRLTEMVNRNGKRLLRLVNDILDFSRLEAGHISLLPSLFRLADVVEDLLEWAQPRAVAQGLRLEVSLDPALPLSVYGDAMRVSQVLSNLLDNALKFTASGSVLMTVSLQAPATPPAEGEAAHRVQFTITDTGVGISPEHLGSLFDSFTQADPTATRRHDGVGLGLAICRDLVDLMSGDLGAVSTPGSGSTFTAVLPLGQPPGEPAGLAEAGSAR
jgi:PAS domain S-box-containing protein